MYTMAIAVFGRDDEWFDRVTPRVLFTMMIEWNDMEERKAKVAGICYASYMNGKNPDEFLGGKEVAKKATEDQMKKNAAAFF